MTKLDFIKTASGLMIGAGTSRIVSETVNRQVYRANNFQKATVFVATMAITAAVTDVVRKHTDAKIDEVADWLSRVTIVAEQ